jgi:hypothetical protein
VSVHAYENEDGDVWMPVSEYPDMPAAAQEYADERWLVVTFQEREKAEMRECECWTVRPRRHCPDSGTGAPCVFRKLDCWHFYASDEPGEEGEQTWYPHDSQGRTLILGHVFRHGSGAWDCLQQHCGPEQAHYRERIEAPGQTALSVGE